MNEMSLFARASLSTFLSTAKSSLSNYNATSQLSSNFTFVIGNESADLDSACCAIVLAYFLTYFSNKNRSPTASVPATLHIPLLNIPRASLSLRPELTSVLKYANLTPSDILTLSDLPDTLPPPEKTRWLLVDHNALTGELGKIYSNRTVGCIDHHEDEGIVPVGHKDGQGLDGEPRVIENVSSCASLVTAWIRERWLSATQKLAIQNPVPETIKNKEPERWRQADAQLARLALAPILVDSACLKSIKTQPKDISAAGFLEGLIMKYEADNYSRSEFFNEVSAAKQNLSALSLDEILRKDYKQWTENDSAQNLTVASSRIGIASIVQPMVFLLAKAMNPPDFLHTLLKFAQNQNLSLFAMMTTSHVENKGFRRELLLWGLDERGIRAGQLFEKRTGKKLGLQKWAQEDLFSDFDHDKGEEEIGDIKIGESWRRCWIQLDTDSSRKQVAPLLRDALKKTLVIH